MSEGHSLLEICLFAIFFLFVGYSMAEYASEEEYTNFFSSEKVNRDDINVKVIDSEKYLCVQDVFVVHFKGNSMQPVLYGGYVGLVRLVDDFDSLKVGNIVIFDEGYDYLVSHRIVDKGEDEFGPYVITKGDNNNYLDGKIRPDMIHSVVAGVLY